MRALFLGYQENNYTNKENNLVEGYNIFYATQDPDHWKGYKPSLIFDRTRKTFSLRYISKKAFDRLGFGEELIGMFIDLSFNESGGIEKVTVIKS